ncbi:ROK family protein [Microcella daejeonensis]|uniref:polyphosphate--glucose phosphotransferase n=1 Tax=Microcella daejeonensis TaxID=2994971 RepID=UPI002271204F|nr:ROK family protein [Microcella daejeonensis]WAB83285.1 ROK family protein [Microcella daejeonensis]
MKLAIGIDIGGTGIKGAVVDLATGELVSDRVKRPTPAGGEPSAIIATAAEIMAELDAPADSPVGVCFPAIVLEGRTMSAANVSDAWIGLDADARFEEVLGRPIHFVNDADAAGFAEARYGAAADRRGLVIVTTLGTGIGSAFVHDGVLIPNTELGHLELEGADVETWASNAVREREGLSYPEWAARLQRFYAHVEFLFSPTLHVVGGGVSKHHEQFLPLLSLRAPIVPARLRNNAGIMGAAALAAR